jgi:hypothetical protein
MDQGCVKCTVFLIPFCTQRFMVCAIMNYELASTIGSCGQFQNTGINKAIGWHNIVIYRNESRQSTDHDIWLEAFEATKWDKIFSLKPLIPFPNWSDWSFDKILRHSPKNLKNNANSIRLFQTEFWITYTSTPNTSITLKIICELVDGCILCTC